MINGLRKLQLNVSEELAKMSVTVVKLIVAMMMLFKMQFMLNK